MHVVHKAGTIQGLLLLYLMSDNLLSLLRRDLYAQDRIRRHKLTACFSVADCAPLSIICNPNWLMHSSIGCACLPLVGPCITHASSHMHSTTTEYKQTQCADDELQ